MLFAEIDRDQDESDLDLEDEEEDVEPEDEFKQTVQEIFESSLQN